MICSTLNEPVTGKPVFGVSDQAPYRPGYTSIEDGYRLQVSDFESKRIILYICVGKTKVLISCVVTTQLICVFVFFAYANRFSHDAAQIE